MLDWFEAHKNLAGWAQVLGAMLALAVTYLTAFVPIWRRKKQLRNAAARLLANGYEAIESYSRTSEYGTPLPISLRQAALSMGKVAEEMSRFPIYELEDQGSNSLARRLVAMGQNLSSMQLVLESMASELSERPMDHEDREALRTLLQMSLETAEALLLGKIMSRPEPPNPLQETL
ncbi:MAG: hypothetical protein AAGH53_12635 [Pseudomonadota bacterium]